MRRYSPTYFIGQGFKGFWRNGMMSFASVTVLLSCLIVMGCFALLVLNIDANLNEIGDLNVIKVFVDDNNTHSEGDEVKLAGKPSADDSDVKFLGWSRDPDATEPEYPAGGTYTVSAEDALSGNVTLYAVWENKPRTAGVLVRYNASGLNIDGALPTDEGEYAQGAEVKLAPALSARYSTITFLGWSLTPGSAEAQFAPDSFYYMDESDAKGGAVTFYAVWSQMPVFSTYTLSYDMNRVSVKGEIPTDESVRIGGVEAKIKALENVASVEHTTPQEVMHQMSEKFIQAGYTELAEAISSGENPYRHEFTVTYIDNNAVSTLEYQLKHIEGVAKVNCRTDYANQIENLKRGIILVFAWFMIILFVVSIFVIMNTVKLSVYARRQEIGIMRYVGATNWFISMPFIVEGMIIGVVASGIAYVIQFYMYKYVQKMMLTDIEMISVIPFGEVRVYVIAGFFFIGILTGVVGSLISLRKYLKA
ncbi:MAG: permease-like cell division protein FtsX [Firmicutes bacterium]|nr:permease-like cell division protein FtsX [Bacillota bacterium]